MEGQPTKKQQCLDMNAGILAENPDFESRGYKASYTVHK